MKTTITKTIKFIIVLIVTMAVGSGARVLGSIINGVHGAPSFVTPAFQVFAVVTNILFIGSYVLLEKYIPTKNKILRGLFFILLFWSSDYISQILGMSGAASPIISADALSVPTIIIDSINYAFSGVVMGLLLSSSKTTQKLECGKKQFAAALRVSMLAFPCIQLALEMLAGLINPQFSCASAFAINGADKLNFYIVFYLFQAISGLIIPIFYRCSEFNSLKSKQWLRFASIYGFMLWTPVVLIMVFFGAAITVTVVFAVNMLIAIYADTYIFAKIMNQKQAKSVLNN